MFKIQFPFSTLYKKLGVKQSDSLEKIKEAYVKLAKEHHPDVSPHSPVDFKDITNAYNILKDPIRRKLYDQELNPEIKTYSSNQHQQYQQYSNHYSKSEFKTYKSRTYNYEKEKNNNNIYILILIGSGTILTAYYLTPIEDESYNPQPKSYQELRQAYDQMKENENYYTHKGEEQTAAIRRQNVIYQNQNLNDPPYLIEKRKIKMEQEMKQKKFTIQVENYDKVVCKGEVKKLQRKSKIQKPVYKNASGDLTLQGYGQKKQMNISKSIPEEFPTQISISHLEQAYM